MKKSYFTFFITASMLAYCQEAHAMIIEDISLKTIKKMKLSPKHTLKKMFFHPQQKKFYSLKLDQYKIHPSIGIARLGNSPDEFYVAPDKIGGRPTEYENEKQPVSNFKDTGGFIKRQAAKFAIYDENGVPIDPKSFASIKWKVHLANKKAAWRSFAELDGNALLYPENTYDKKKVLWRNSTIQIKSERQKKLIIDPGYRELTVANTQQKAIFDEDSVPPDYKYASFPAKALAPYPISSLGEMHTNEKGELFVLGGFGNSAGSTPISSYAGADGWFDDISDGYVQAILTPKEGGEPITLKAWVVVGSPKYAPELSNIATWDDIIFDMAVRYKSGFAPNFFDIQNKRYILGEQGYRPSFEHDIKPIFKRMKEYQWVGSIAPMIAFSTPDFDISDNSDNNKKNRQMWFNYLRKSSDLRHVESPELHPDHQTLFNNNEEFFPKMPLNAGDNPVVNSNISKFVSLTPTQEYMLSQWAEGFFDKSRKEGGSKSSSTPLIHPLDISGVGNCVGSPMSPGIEVTWSVRNPAIYDDNYPYSIKQAEVDPSMGLNPNRDETEVGSCEPGDLTKRMAIPWQADFFNCSIQYINFTHTRANKTPERMPVTPTYFAYWWPAQAPWNVYTSNKTHYEQALDGGNPAGLQTMFQRGINSFAQMIESWKYLGFIKNDNNNEETRDIYQSFVESERNLDKFQVGFIAVDPDGNLIANQKCKQESSNTVKAQDYNFSVFFASGSPHQPMPQNAQMQENDQESENVEGTQNNVRKIRTLRNVVLHPTRLPAEMG